MNGDPRPTTASIDGRVERLESTVGGLVVDMALVKQGQANLNTLVTAQHVAVTGQLANLSAELRTFLNSAQTQAAEPQATPAGRAILAALRERDAEREKEHAAFEAGISHALAEAGKNRYWIAGATGALAVIVLVVNLLAPVALRLMGF